MCVCGNIAININTYIICMSESGSYIRNILYYGGITASLVSDSVYHTSFIMISVEGVDLVETSAEDNLQNEWDPYQANSIVPLSIGFFILVLCGRCMKAVSHVKYRRVETLCERIIKFGQELMLLPYRISRILFSYIFICLYFNVF